MALLQVGVQHIFRPVFLTGSSAVILLLNACTVLTLGHGMIRSASLICTFLYLQLGTLTYRNYDHVFSDVEYELGNGSIIYEHTDMYDYE